MVKWLLGLLFLTFVNAEELELPTCLQGIQRFNCATLKQISTLIEKSDESEVLINFEECKDVSLQYLDEAENLCEIIQDSRERANEETGNKDNVFYISVCIHNFEKLFIAPRIFVMASKCLHEKRESIEAKEKSKEDIEKECKTNSKQFNCTLYQNILNSFEEVSYFNYPNCRSVYNVLKNDLNKLCEFENSNEIEKVCENRGNVWHDITKEFFSLNDCIFESECQKLNQLIDCETLKNGLSSLKKDTNEDSACEKEFQSVQHLLNQLCELQETKPSEEFCKFTLENRDERVHRFDILKECLRKLKGTFNKLVPEMDREFESCQNEIGKINCSLYEQQLRDLEQLLIKYPKCKDKFELFKTSVNELCEPIKSNDTTKACDILNEGRNNRTELFDVTGDCFHDEEQEKITLDLQKLDEEIKVSNLRFQDCKNIFEVYEYPNCTERINQFKEVKDKSNELNCLKEYENFLLKAEEFCKNMDENNNDYSTFCKIDSKERSEFTESYKVVENCIFEPDQEE